MNWDAFISYRVFFDWLHHLLAPGHRSFRLLVCLSTGISLFIFQLQGDSRPLSSLSIEF